jgi:hypothetical protein
MGWTSTRYTKKTHQEFDNDALEDFLNNEFGDGLELAKVHLHKDPEQHEIYGIFRSVVTRKAFLGVILLKIHNDEIYWKEMDENMGPSYYNCPIDYFRWVPTEDEYATAWRDKCKKEQNGKA